MIRNGLCICLVIVVAANGWAQVPGKTRPNVDSQPKSKNGRKTVSKQRPRPNKRQVKQALAFARTHHSELASLIERLKAVRDRSAYDKAIAELSRTVQRIEPVKVTNPKRHAMLVELWKLESQARPMVARSMVKPDPKNGASLREILRERAELRRIMLQADIKRSRARVERFQSQLKALENLDRATDRELQRLRRSARMTVTRKLGRGGKTTAEQPVKPRKTTVKTTVKTKDKSKP